MAVKAAVMASSSRRTAPATTTAMSTSSSAYLGQVLTFLFLDEVPDAEIPVQHGVNPPVSFCPCAGAGRRFGLVAPTGLPAHRHHREPESGSR